VIASKRMPRSRAASVALGTVAALVLAAPVRAQEVTAPVSAESLSARTYEPGRATQGQVSLGDAVALTLRYQPQLALAGQDVRAAEGRYREARGLFDSTFRFSPGVDYTQQPAAPGLLKQTRDQRTLLLKVAAQFTDLNVALRDVLRDARNPLPRCPLDVNFNTDTFLVDGLDPGELSVRGVNRDTIPVNVDLESALGFSTLADFCTNPLGDSPLDAIRLELSYGRVRDIPQGQQFGLGPVLEGGLEAPFESIALLAEISEAVAARARIALERLGPVAEDEFTRTFNLQTGLFKPFRNGISVSLDLFLSSSEQNFRDKILDPGFGGMGVNNRFPSNFTIGLNLPLGKGLGADSAQAAERSARFTLNARTEQARHTVTEEVYRTLLAYLNLVGAQENLRLLEESAARQRSLMDLTDQRIKGGETPQIEGSRVRARASTVNASVQTARAALAEARFSLAEAAGLEAGSLAEAPAASDRFAEPRLDPGALADLLKSAADQRHDVRALDFARQASAALTAGARSDLKRRFDLSLKTGLANNYESELFRFLPDERNPIFSEIAPPTPLRDADRYYWPSGFYRSLTGRWEPFVLAQITVDFPFANNAAKGRLAQAQATLRSSEIDLGDRRRVIGEGLTGVHAALRSAAEAIQRGREAVDRDRQSLDSIVGLLKAGESTVIDTLTTEEELVRDQLELVRQLQTYYNLLARLRFESGQLVTFANEGSASEAARFVPTEFVTR
jgi:outer membrane protein TolC